MKSDGEINSGITGKMEIQALGVPVHSTRSVVLANFRHSANPGSPPSRPYEAPTPGAGWASTPGGNYSEAGTPRDSSAYANAPSPYLPSTPGQPMTPNSASYLP
ncbi:putative transcription elongation factor SPT5, partial [Trifolium medium]|nr:putative transcription elongation factor SPT5 [Trifolium medium]